MNVRATVLKLLLGIPFPCLSQLEALKGRVPDPTELTEKLFVLCNKIEELGTAELGTAGLSHVLAKLGGTNCGKLS